MRKRSRPTTMIPTRSALLLVLFVLPPSCGQAADGDTAPEFSWTDESGTLRTTGDIEAVPKQFLSMATGMVTGARALDGAHFVARGGTTFRLIGIDTPRRDGDAPALSFMADEAKSALANTVVGKRMRVRFDLRTKDADGFRLCYLERPEGGDTVNEELVSRGLARVVITWPNVKLEESLRRRHADAKAGGIGLHGAPKTERGPHPKVHCGFCLGLYAKQSDFNYEPYLKEIAETGANAVCFLVPWFLETHDAVRIVPVPARTAPMSVVDRTIRQARGLGLSVTLLPIVLLRNPGKDYWRGNIEPKDIDHWFDAYNRFILSYADVAESAGAGLFSIGSEFSSLENRTRHWELVVSNVRSRFGGQITYSANWDHIDTIEFWDRIDVIGMTGYHSLTQKDDPTVAEIAAKWEEIRDKLVLAQERRKKPFIFTELGYASQNGINKDPWNYFISKTQDLDEQADCYEAFALTWRKASDLFRGAYFYTWWRNNDADDRLMYTPHNKPALDVIRRYFKEMRGR